MSDIFTAWAKAGIEDDSGDATLFEDEMWWGFWREMGDAKAAPPDALFRSYAEAKAMVELAGRGCVRPGVVRLVVRGNDKVPTPERRGRSPTR